MNREIKFRAWEKEHSQYVPDKFLDQIFLRQDGRLFWYSHAGFEDVTGKFDVELWTGLNDKKQTEEYPDGQEIYEGDKVKASRIGFIPDTLIVAWDHDRASWSLENDRGDHRWAMNAFDELEVIEEKP